MSTSIIRPTLEIMKGTTILRTCEISGPDFHIGRLPNLDLFIDDNRVSRPHARIQRLADGSYQLMDLKSQNQTYLNGRRLGEYQPALLRDGDRIKIVEYEIIFHHAGSVVHAYDDRSVTVLETLNDLSSDHLVSRSKHPSATLKAILEVVRASAAAATLATCWAMRWRD